MAKRKKDETENFENESAQPNAETENANAGDDNANAGNDEGAYDFSKTFEKANQTRNETETPLDVDALLKEYAPKKERKERKTKEKTAAQETQILIPGELLIHVSDNIMVGGIGWLDAFFSKEPIDAQLLALRADQKQQLIPSANAAAAEIAKYISANPILLFVASLGATYVSNYLIIRALMMQAKRSEPQTGNAKQNGFNESDYPNLK